MTLNQEIAFFIFSVVAAITPGPSNVMIMANGAAVGVMRGVPSVLGASTAMALLIWIVALGLGELILGAPMLVTIMNGCGTAFVLWLAWRILAADPSSSYATAQPVGFIGAATFQFVNPKGWLVATGAISTFMRDAAGEQIIQSLKFAALFFAAALPTGLAWLLLGAMMHRLRRNALRARVFNIVMASALIISVAMMFQ